MANLVTVYMSDDAFVPFVKALPSDRKRIMGVDGLTRWIIKGDDGGEYVLRPESSRKNI